MGFGPAQNYGRWHRDLEAASFGQAVLDLVVQPEAVPPIVTTVLDEGPKITPDGSDGVAEEAAISVQPGQEASSSGDTEATPGTVDGQTGNGSSPTATSADVRTPAKEQAPAVAPGSDSDEAESGTST